MYIFIATRSERSGTKLIEAEKVCNIVRNLTYTMEDENRGFEMYQKVETNLNSIH